ncbi:MAG: hypothetical protein HAW62_01930 [Endozoicomonadaceae bacterium]|nr:hypothetical protein [Endozoicomonadaceae bacterium]
MLKIQQFNQGIKYINILSCCVMLYALGLSQILQATPLPKEKTQIVRNSVVAVVNQQPILESELQRKIAQSYQPPGISKKSFRHEQLNELIDFAIQLQQTELYNINITEEHINDVIANILEQNKISKEKFIIELEKKQITYSQFKKQVENELRIYQVRQTEIPNRINITHQNIEKFLSSDSQLDTLTYLLGHIVIDIPEDASPQDIQDAEETINNILAKLETNPNTFKTLAKQYSHSLSAQNGGDLGWKVRKTLPDDFKNILKKMKKNDISKPFKTKDGFHILTIWDIKGDLQHIVDLYHIKQIVIAKNQIRSSTEAKKIIHEIYNTLQHKEKTQVSSDSKLTPTIQPEDLGWLNPNALHKTLAEKVKALPMKQYSPPFQIDDSWYIIEVIDKKTKNITREIQEKNAKNILINQAFQEQIPHWLEDLKANTYIRKL